MMNYIDVKQLLPEFYLESVRVKDFVDVVNEVVNEIYLSIEDTNKLIEVDTVGEFLLLLMKNLGFKHGTVFSEDYNKFIIKNIKSLYSIKSSNLFIDNFIKLLHSVCVYTDLGKKVVALSYQQRLSEGFLQDATYYRDGSIEVSMSGEQASLLKRMFEEYVTAGVYVWYYVISNLDLFRSKMYCSNMLSGLGHDCEDRVKVILNLQQVHYMFSNTKVRASGVVGTRYPSAIMSNNFIV